MKVLLLAAAALAGLAAANPTVQEPIVVQEFRHLPVYGAPLVGVRYGDQPADGLATQEALGWRALYDAPFILAVQQDSKPELAAFLVKDGLRSLPFTEDRRFLLTHLLAGPEKVGVLLSGSNFVSLPQIDMPITRFVLPSRFTLAESARLHADFYSFPTLLVVNREDLSSRDLVRLGLVGDFVILPDSVKVSSDVPAPAARWGRRNTPAYTVVNKANSAPSLSTLPGYSSVPVTSSYSLDVNPFLQPFLTAKAGQH
ncbi:putative monofunctional riboflavin biosynthesis protein RIBA 3, chloroplastic [Frankliniella fusca]|uniref:Monofunctional riboflavin biosynthesis protein RIBA 3, chloroplastic n=1 Tax=Frankliniella fusca TaxID=407009 RepID=A0AAE1LQ17_9NEOP|nr:putative monofunctional riboflavin biosynthesis protein RIBA 3, chloroplastic [Frankliniella fusca]